MDAANKGVTDSSTKLSARKSIGVRPGALRDQLDILYAELLKQDAGLKLSDIIRDGLVQFWPQISAFLRARQQVDVKPSELTQLVLVCAKAQEHGITATEIEGALSELIERKLEPTAT